MASDKPHNAAGEAANGEAALIDGRQAFLTRAEPGRLGRFLPGRIRDYYTGGPKSRLGRLPYPYQRAHKLFGRRLATMRNLTVAGGIGAGAATLGAFGAVVGGFGSLWAGDIAAFVGSRGSRLPVHPAKRPADARGRYVLDVGAEFTSRLTDSQGDYGPEALREHFLGPMAERLAQGEVEIDLSNVTEISPDFAEKAFAGMGASLTDEQARRLSFKGPQAQAAREALAAGLQQSAETSFQRLASLSGQIREAAPEARAVMPPHPDKAHPDKARPAMPGPAGL